MKILFRRAALPVEEARDGVKISPDRLYVITPNTTLTISNDILHSRIRDPAERPHRPVDILFHSLAEKKEPNVAGVILSGSGSDGAKGIQAIKEAGGVTFAEQEDSASFFGMPSSAIQTGCVDFILNPCDIARGAKRHQPSLLSPKGKRQIEGQWSRSLNRPAGRTRCNVHSKPSSNFATRPGIQNLGQRFIEKFRSRRVAWPGSVALWRAQPPVFRPVKLSRFLELAENRAITVK